MMELPRSMHPWFVGVQFHRNSRPRRVTVIPSSSRSSKLRLPTSKRAECKHEAVCDFEVGLDKPFFLIAGTCVVESEQMTIDTAGRLKEICAKLNIPFIYKSSYDKANRAQASRSVASEWTRACGSCPR